MQDAHRKFLALWNAISAEDGIARLSRLDLRSIAPMLPWLTILETDHEGVLRFRLGGSGLEAELGCGLRGRKVIEFCSNVKTVEVAVAFVKKAIENRTGLYLSGSYTSIVHPGQHLEALGLPFLDDKKSERPGQFVFVQVYAPIENRNRDFTNLWGQGEISIDEIFEVHVGEPLDHEAVPADIRHMVRRQGITVGSMPPKRMAALDAD